MTAVDQVLGVYTSADGWRVTWVRLDPGGAGRPGYTIQVQDEPLACDVTDVDSDDLVDSPPFAAAPEPVVVQTVFDAPPNRREGTVEDAAISRAASEFGADPARWVNKGIPGWAYMCRLRGHE